MVIVGVIIIIQACFIRFFLLSLSLPLSFFFQVPCSALAVGIIAAACLFLFFRSRPMNQQGEGDLELLKPMMTKG